MSLVRGMLYTYGYIGTAVGAFIGGSEFVTWGRAYPDISEYRLFFRSLCVILGTGATWPVSLPFFITCPSNAERSQ